MLKRSDSGKAVGVQLAVRTVVEAENVARCGPAARGGARKPAFGAFGDRSDAGDKPFGGGGKPFPGYKRPHGDLLCEFARHAHNTGIAETVGWAKPASARAGGGGIGVVAAAQ